LVRLAPIEIGSHWTLAGEHLLNCQGMGPRLAGENLPENIDRIHELGVKSEEIDAVREASRLWHGGISVTGGVYPLQSAGEMDPDLRRGWTEGWWCADAPDGVFMAGGWSENHSIRDFAKAMRIGFAGIRREVEQRQASIDVTDLRCGNPAGPTIRRSGAYDGGRRRR
jgi:hypothetical protein